MELNGAKITRLRDTAYCDVGGTLAVSVGTGVAVATGGLNHGLYSASCGCGIMISPVSALRTICGRVFQLYCDETTNNKKVRATLRTVYGYLLSNSVGC